MNWKRQRKIWKPGSSAIKRDFLKSRSAKRQRRGNVNVCSTLIFRYLTALCLLPTAFCLLFSTKRNGTIPSIAISIAFAIAVALAFADAAYGFASMGRRHVVSRIAFGSRARDCAGPGRHDVVWH